MRLGRVRRPARLAAARPARARRCRPRRRRTHGPSPRRCWRASNSCTRSLVAARVSSRPSGWARVTPTWSAPGTDSRALRTISVRVSSSEDISVRLRAAWANGLCQHVIRHQKGSFEATARRRRRYVCGGRFWTGQDRRPPSSAGAAPVRGPRRATHRRSRGGRARCPRIGKSSVVPLLGLPGGHRGATRSGRTEAAADCTVLRVDPVTTWSLPAISASTPSRATSWGRPCVLARPRCPASRRARRTGCRWVRATGR